MEAINVEAEYRKFSELTHYPMPYDLYVLDKVRTGQWVEDDGDYYLSREWDAHQKVEEMSSNPTVTPEVQVLVNLAKSKLSTPTTKSVIYAALRSLDIEPDTL